MGSNNLPGFCAAPWVEGVLYNNGIFHTCCRNSTVFGNWISEGLQNSWHSRALQDFRCSIVRGEFPDNMCKNCYSNGTARSLRSELLVPFKQYANTVFNFLGKTVPEVEALESLFVLGMANNDSENVLGRFFLSIDRFIASSLLYPDDVRLAMAKLKIIGRITKGFLEGDLTPPQIAPFRQVQLIARCNARCIQCPGRFTGEIYSGLSLDESYIDAAFSHSDEIIDFFMNGSEFLLYPGWKRVADYLVKRGIKLSISSNGILLAPSTIRFLIDNKIIHKLNVSIDGATRESVEFIRANVNYDQLIRNISYIFLYAKEKRYNFDLSFSFVLLKRNYHEFPQLVSLIHRLRSKSRTLLERVIPGMSAENKYPTIQIFCQALENYPIKGYEEFVREEHHSMVDKNKLEDAFKKAFLKSKQTNIPVDVFYSYTMEGFINSGFPFPPLRKSA